MGALQATEAWSWIQIKIHEKFGRNTKIFESTI